MSGQGRARGRGGRGRAHQQQPPPPPGQTPPPQPAQQPPPGGAGAGPGPAPVGRGRSRGARGAAAAEQAAAAAQQVVQPPTAPAEGHTGGRGVQRGGGRERPSAGGNGEPPVGEMAELGIGDRPYRRRMPWEKYEDKKWKHPDKDPRGKTGNPVTLVTNYFRVHLESEAKVYQYSVEFKPMLENVRVKFALISSLSAVTGPVKCFDGGILYLRRRLEKDVTECTATRSYDNALINITFTHKCEVLSTSPQFLQIANLLLKRCQVALDMKQIRDHYFNLALSVQIPRHKLEVMPGFTTSILKYEDGNLLGVDIVHKILRIDTFLDCLYNLHSTMQGSQLSAFHAAALKNFVGTIVMTKYNNKTYKVDDINWEGRPSSTFEKNGVQVSYEDYYKEHWNITIVDKHQPLLVTRPTDKDFRRGDKQNMFLLPELCTITGLSDEARSDFKVMQDLAVHTRIGPEQRVKTLEDFLGQLNSSDKVKEILTPWQMAIERRAARIPGRQLPAENLLMRDARGQLTKITYNIKEADWGRNMRNVHLLNPRHLESWLLIFPNRSSQQASQLSDALSRVGKGMGMRINSPTVIELQNDRNEAYLQAIRQNLTDKVQMVVTVLSNNKKDRYDAIKKSCCIDNAVPSQCVLTKTLSRQQGLMSVATKIAIQMNCKMGGDVWGGEIPLSGLMVVGMDSYHDSANKGFSVGGVVASLNKECTRYYSRTETHHSKVETMSSLTVLFAEALKKYHGVNGALPQKIIIYRDGVGDGQLTPVFNNESGQIKEAFTAAAGQGYKPGMAFVVVKKRINTRLFAPEGNKLGNPQPGTIVDQFITKPDWYDFFLVSQSVRQGTVTPTAYNVIFDESGLQPDHIQRLTYKLTHLYFNWQGTIRVPAPCQYAHKLAFLQGQSLHREFSATLADKLFYL